MPRYGQTDEQAAAEATPCPLFETAEHSGDLYVPRLDSRRLKSALGRIFGLMADGTWRTVVEIAAALGLVNHASIQAQLRKVGVHMDIQMLDKAVVWERLGFRWSNR